MNSTPFRSDETDPAALEAADWLVKRDRGLTASEQDDFFQWLASDPRHGDCFARQQRTWKEFNQLAQWRPEHSAEPNPDLLAKEPARDAAVGRVARWWSGPVRRRLVWVGPLAAAAGFAAILVWTRSPRAAPVAPPPPAVAEHVAQGYERRVLADGSVVELNAGTKIEVDYLPAERRVHLVQGEASFAVAKNHDRPFIVRAGGVDVKAVGTAFNVRLDAKSVEVLVIEGKVRVDDAVRGDSLLAATKGGEAPLLEAGQKVTLQVAPIAAVASVPVSSAEVDQMLAWRPVRLDFNALPLGRVIGQFNRRNRLQIVLADPALAALPIVASFRSDNVEGFVRLLELTSNVKAERSGDTITLKAAR